MRGWLRMLFRHGPSIGFLYGSEHASHPDRIGELSDFLRWAYFNGYCPVPGRSVFERRSDGSYRIVIEMTKGD